MQNIEESLQFAEGKLPPLREHLSAFSTFFFSVVSLDRFNSNVHVADEGVLSFLG